MVEPASSRMRAVLLARAEQAEAELHTIATRWVELPALVPDLTLRQLQVLALLRTAPGSTGQQLAEAVGVTTPTMSGIIDRIAAKGWIERNQDPTDRRRVLLSPTPSGLEALVALEAPLQSARGVLVARLDDDELGDLTRVMERLRDIARELEAEKVSAAEKPSERS